MFFKKKKNTQGWTAEFVGYLRNYLPEPLCYDGGMGDIIKKEDFDEKERMELQWNAFKHHLSKCEASRLELDCHPFGTISGWIQLFSVCQGCNFETSTWSKPSLSLVFCQTLIHLKTTNNPP